MIDTGGKKEAVVPPLPLPLPLPLPPPRCLVMPRKGCRELEHVTLELEGVTHTEHALKNYSNEST
jgi:hypothetical protein